MAVPLILSPTHSQQTTTQNQHNYLVLRVIVTFIVAQIEVKLHAIAFAALIPIATKVPIFPTLELLTVFV